jgi:hypothetical protein
MLFTQQMQSLKMKKKTLILKRLLRQPKLLLKMLMTMSQVRKKLQRLKLKKMMKLKQTRRDSQKKSRTSKKKT